MQALDAKHNIKASIGSITYHPDGTHFTSRLTVNNETVNGKDVGQIKFDSICDRYGFEEIKKDNIGICGGRQFIAEHSDENGFDYHFFFEDDMFFYLGQDEFCRNGFRRKIKDFYNIVMDIVLNTYIGKYLYL